MTRNFTTAPTVYGRALDRWVDPAQSTNMVQWTSAVATRATKPCDVVIVGDSYTEGSNGTGATPVYGSRWHDWLRRYVQRCYSVPNVPSGAGYVAPEGAINSSFTVEWVLSAATKSNAWGWGWRSISLAGTGQSATITVAGDRFWIMFSQSTAAGAFTVTTDGGAPVTVTSGGAASNKSGRCWDSGPLTRTIHTVTVTGTATGTAIVDGIMVFDGDGPADATTGVRTGVSALGRGVRFWEGGFGGYQTNDFAGANSRWADMVSDTVSPDLALIELGINDMANAVSVATYKTNLADIATKLRVGNSACDIMLVAAPWVGASTGTPSSQAQWDLYVQAMYELAEANGYSVLDARRAFGKPTANNDILSTGHPTLAGHRAMGEVAARLLTGSEASPRDDSDGASPTSGQNFTPVIPETHLVNAISGTGVLTGLAVTAQAPATMVLNVSAGNWAFAGNEQTPSAAGTVTVGTAHAAYTRYDVVSVSTGGTISVTAGAAAAAPVLPVVPIFQQLVAIVRVAAGATAIGNGDIYQRNIPPPSAHFDTVKALTTAYTHPVSNTTLANVSGLSFQVAPSENWVAEGLLFVSGAQAGDIKLQFTGPTSPTAVRYGFTGFDVAATTSTGAVATSAMTQLTAAAFSTALTMGLAGATGSVITMIPFWLRLRNGSTAGTVQLQAAQGTSNATATVINTESYMHCIRG